MDCKWRLAVVAAVAVAAGAAGAATGGGLHGMTDGAADQRQAARQLPLPGADRLMAQFMPVVEIPPYGSGAEAASGPGAGAPQCSQSQPPGAVQGQSTPSSVSVQRPLLGPAAADSSMLLQHQHHHQQPLQNAVNQVFDFASFMWDAEDAWQDERQPASLAGVVQGHTGAPALAEVPPMNVPFQNSTCSNGSPNGSRATDTTRGRSEAPSAIAEARLPGLPAQQQHQQQQHQQEQEAEVQRNAGVSANLAQEAPAAENYRLMDYFIHAVTPPILAEVETQKKWLVMRRVLVGRANASSMVRWAILAFSNFLLVQREGAWLASRQNHYENALAEVLAAMDMAAAASVLLDDGGHGATPSATTAASAASTTIVPATKVPLQRLATHASTAVGYAAAGVSTTGTLPPASSQDHGTAKAYRILTGSVQARAAASQPLLSLARSSTHRENLLATLFFLSYVDILEGRIGAAHANLKRAHDILQSSEKGGVFSPVERQFLLWLRLLDARAVSAGGEGLFLSADDELLLVETPPAAALEAELGRLDHEGAGGGANAGAAAAGVAASVPQLAAHANASTPGDAPAHDDIEDVLFQILYQPGILFFQKVQSFMGRISRIDPWHRPRGTVEDEIDVMNIGAAIAADLRTLYDSRPILMDYAVAGKLTAAHVSAQLAFAVTRSFRTYLCNYYASKVHLHRVAYKTLPLTQEASGALAQIRHLARLLVEALDAEDALPANMLWPLLMLGSEEPDPVERAWIRTQMLRMEKVAGNSKITAHVLAELQARQDAAQARVDIRSVMHAIFNSCFAIV